MKRITVALNVKSLAEAAGDGWFDLLVSFSRRSPLSGRVEEITDADLDALFNNFDATGPGVPVGYNHADLKGALDPDSTQAAGWIRELRKTDDGKLQGRIEFNESGAERVRKGQFAFLSAEIVPDALPDDPTETDTIGSLLVGATLTNRPFAPGLDAVRLSDDLSAHFDTGDNAERTDKVLKHAIKALGLDESATTEDATKALDELTDQRDALMAEIETLNAKLAELEAQIAAGDGGEGEAAQAMTALSERINVLEARNRTLEHEAVVGQAVQANRIAPAERAAAIQVLDAGGSELFDSVYPVERKATLAGAAQVGNAGSTDDASPEMTKLDTQLAVAKKMAEAQAEGKNPSVAEILLAEGNEALREAYTKHEPNVVGL